MAAATGIVARDKTLCCHIEQTQRGAGSAPLYMTTLPVPHCLYLISQWLCGEANTTIGMASQCGGEGRCRNSTHSDFLFRICVSEESVFV